MNAIRILCRRDIRSWLSLPTFYLMGMVFLGVTGLAFWGFAVTMGGRGLLTTEITFNGMVFWMAFLAMASAVSVKLLGDEQERGTMELLLTSPVSEVQVVVAKFWAGFSLILALAVPAVLYPWMLKGLYPGWHGTDFRLWLSGCLLLSMLAGLMTLTGMFWSQMFRRQTAASVATFLTGTMIVFRGSLRSWIGGGEADASTGFVAVASHISSFSSGFVDSRFLVFYLSGMAALLFMNIRLLQWARYRRSSGGMNVAVSFLLMLILAGFVNYLAMLHPIRMDVSSLGNSPLPTALLKTLEHAKSPVRIILLSPIGNSTATAARRVVEKYRFAHPLLQIETVDQSTELIRARELAGRYQLRESTVLIVSCGNRFKVLPLRVTEHPSIRGDGPEQHRASQGAFLEAEMILAIRSVVQEKAPVVYFLTGHDERSPSDFTDYKGYSEIAGMIRDRHIEIRPLLLGAAESVPNDCSALVIAGPERGLAAWEVGKIRDYLARSGRLMVLMDSGSRSGLEPLLDEWGVRLGQDRVIDSKNVALLPTNRDRAPVLGLGEVSVIRYGRHVITDGLDGLVSTFVMPQSVEPVPSSSRGGSLSDHADRPRVIELAFSSGKSWAEVDFEQNPPQYNEGYDRSGPVALAVCVEKGISSELTMDIKPVRMVVVGDSQFAANRCLSGGNEAFFINALEWLLEREDHLSGATERGGLYTLKIESDGRRVSFGVIVMALPLLLVGLGFMVGVARRDRRSNPASFRKELAGK